MRAVLVVVDLVLYSGVEFVLDMCYMLEVPRYTLRTASIHLRSYYHTEYSMEISKI